MQTLEALLGLLLVRSACPLRHPLVRATRAVGLGIKPVGSSSSTRHHSLRLPSARRMSSHTVVKLTAAASPTTAAAAAAVKMPSTAPVSVHWFRKGLRLHDNRALLEACDEADVLYPLFVVDSDPASSESRAGSLRCGDRRAQDAPEGAEVEWACLQAGVYKSISESLSITLGCCCCCSLLYRESRIMSHFV